MFDIDVVKCYPKLLGKVSISFIEPTLGGGRERRCIYDEDRDVDMIIFTPDQFEKALKDGVAGWVMNRGYKVLYDTNNYKNIFLFSQHLGCKKVVTRRTVVS